MGESGKEKEAIFKGAGTAGSWEGLLAFFKREKIQIHCGGWVKDCVHQKKAVEKLICTYSC